MIQQQPVTFLVRQIHFQSNNYYQSKVDQMLQYTHPNDHPLLENLLQDISQNQPQMSEVQDLHYYLTHTTRRQFETLLDILLDNFLQKFLQNTQLAVFIIFINIVYRRVDDTQQIAQKVYNLLQIKNLSCFVLYFQLLKWLRQVFQSKKMAGFMKYVQQDLQKVQEPLLSLYESQLYLNLCFYKRESGENIEISEKIIKNQNQNLNIEQFLYDEFRSHYLKHDLQKMGQSKKKIYSLQNVVPEMKAYCCNAISHILGMRNRILEAVVQLQEGLSYDENSARMYYQLALCYFFLKQWSNVCKTIHYFEMKDIPVNQRFASQIWAMKGRAIYQLNKLTNQDDTFDEQHMSKAFDYCSKARRYDENNFIANETLVFIYLHFGNTQAAINFLQSIINDCPQKYKNKLLILLSYCYFLGKYQSTQIPILSMTEQSLANGFIYQFIVELVKFYRPQLQHSFQLRFKQFQEIYASKFINIGLEARKQGKIDYAMIYYTKGLEMSSQNIRGKLQMAECLKLKKKEFSSLKYFKQAINKIQETKQSQIMLSKRPLVKSMLELYVRLFTKNSQLKLIEVKSALTEAEKFLKDFQLLLSQKNQEQLRTFQQNTIQKLKKILSKDRTELYFDLVKFYFKNNLPEYALDIVSQAKRDLFGFIDSASEPNAIIKASYHTTRVFIELEKFQQAQKCLIEFWTAIQDNKLQEQFGKQWRESYQFLFAILRQKYRNNQLFDLDSFESFIRPSINEKVLSQIGNLLFQNKQLTKALKYFLQARKLNPEKSTFQKIIEIYKVQPDLMEQDQILLELLCEYEKMAEKSTDYKFLIAAAKLLRDFDRVQKYYSELQAQSKTSQLFVQISKDLAEFYQLNGKMEQSCKKYTQYFVLQPSNQVMIKVQKMMQNRYNPLLTERQFCKLVLNLITQVTDFQKFLIDCRYNQFNQSLTFVSRWVKQLRFLSPNELRGEVESKTSLIKRASSRNCLCGLLIQNILYALLFRAMPTNKTIQNMIRISLRPRLFKTLGITRQFFGKEQVGIILGKINQQLSQDNMELILNFMLYQNEIMKKTEQNKKIWKYIKQYFGESIMEDFDL